MNDHGLTKGNLLSTLPAALREDPAVAALAEAAAEALASRSEEIDRLRIYPAVDRLEEPLLDILARDFKVDWWDPEYSVEEKRRTLKGNWYVHKHLGTKAAVETAIRAVYPLTTVEEWFEYGGEPYHFRLNVDITSDSGDKARQRRVLERLNYYKSLRSHNDGVRYFLAPEKSWAAARGLFTGSREIDRAFISVPPLKRPGGKTALIAGGGLAGVRRRIDAAVPVPPLARPQGAASRAVGTRFVGSAGRIMVGVNAGGVKRPTGRAPAGASSGVFHSYQRVRISIRNPVISERSL